MARAATRVLTASVPVSLAANVDQMADRLELEEERDRLTRVTLADVDAGRVIDLQTVQLWSDRLDTDEPLPVPR
ncbi:CopG family transcriptional regulator [Thiocapsa rosea]|uniref:Uncharacterized protein n=1 Tax=Thiocapsa rosea TaxID=69360 RepID=A0A495VBK2_9GAMM|nr:CopG family transcriptional regulator [Thiocapsa rosea]RKT46654.1 hypothetical protein BDD21_4184 [Thiocapsa rosea]